MWKSALHLVKIHSQYRVVNDASDLWQRKEKEKVILGRKKTKVTLLQEPLFQEKKDFLSFSQTQSVQAKQKQTKAKSLFFFYFSLKHSIQASQETRISIFKTKLQIKTVKILWRRKSILHQHLFLLLSLFFLIIFI